MNLHKQTILNNSKHKYKNTWSSSSPTSLQAVNIHPEMHVFGLFECHVIEIAGFFKKR